MFTRWLTILCFCFTQSLTSQAATHTLYEVDRSVFDKYPELTADFVRLQDAFEHGEISRADHKLRLSILQKIISKEPNWVDGYWLYSAESFVLAATYDSPALYPIAKPILQDGIQSAERCLEKDTKQVLCKFFLASLIAKQASMEGVLASMRLGFRIQSLWNDVLASPYDFWFRSNSSLQGSVRYGLGVFYRLVPNRWLMETMFQIRGSLDKSVQMHREGLAINPDDPCSRLMLGTALVCRCRSDKQDADCREGVTYLESAQQSRALDANQRVCQRDGLTMLKDHEMACGYTQALPANEVAAGF